jgi:glycosyltransferase involved in cell wall biosynthesis
LITSLPRGVAIQNVPGSNLHQGLEIRLEPGREAPRATDLQDWRDVILAQPVHPCDTSAHEGPIVHTFMRTAEGGAYSREIGILYDFTPLVVPHTHRDDTRRAFSEYCDRDLPHHDAFLAISESTRFDAEWLGGIDPDCVAVAHPGPSQCVETHAWEGAPPARGDFALVVSTLEPRKNGPFVLEWFFQTDRLPRHYELLWAGPEGWLNGNSEPHCPNPYQRKVRFLGMVSDAELCRLYQSARFSIYGSLYEGFGFPVLDSLRHGTPVLCACNSSLREFAGPGVHYFDARDRHSLDEACDALLHDGPGPIRRPDLDESCSWARSAQQLIRLCLQGKG